MPNEEQKDKGFSMPNLSLKEHPWLILVFGLGGGSLGGGLLAQTLHPVVEPVIEAAITEHEQSSRSHNIDRILEKLSSLEDKLGEHDQTLDDLKVEIKILNQRLEGPTEEE